MVLDLSVRDSGSAPPSVPSPVLLGAKFGDYLTGFAAFLNLMHKIAWYLANFDWQESMLVVSFCV